MKIKNPKIDISLFSVLKYLSSGITIISVIIVALLGIFIYNNVYKTFTSIGVITELQQKVTQEELRMKKFEDIEGKLEIKNSPTKLNISQKTPFKTQ